MIDSRWEQHRYFAKWDEWHIARCVVFEVDMFVVWCRNERVPYVFGDAKSAVQWIGEIEKAKPDVVDRVSAKPLTKEQMEVI